MVEVRLQIFECEERDWDIVLQDLIGFDATNIRKKDYNENQEMFTVLCELPNERLAERFVNQVSQAFLCNTKILG